VHPKHPPILGKGFVDLAIGDRTPLEGVQAVRLPNEPAVVDLRLPRRVGLAFFGAIFPLAATFFAGTALLGRRAFSFAAVALALSRRALSSSRITICADLATAVR